MDRYGYPATADHKAAHRQGAQDAELLVRLLVAPGFQIRTLAQPLQDWIETHMCGADARLAEFLNRQHVEPCVPDTGVFGEADTPIPETPDGNS
jgi:hemerythrin